MKSAPKTDLRRTSVHAHLKKSALAISDRILLWPVQLAPANSDGGSQDHAAVLSKLGPNNPWREIEDEFTGDPLSFQERHYNEFVTFLPPVQRFLYGSGRGKISGSVCAESPISVFRRSDIATVRVHLTPDSPTTRSQCRACRPLFLFRDRHRHFGARTLHERHFAGGGAGRDVPLGPRLSGLLGTDGTSGALPEQSRVRHAKRVERWRRRTTKIVKNF